MGTKEDTRVSMSYLVRVWQENPAAPWQFWIKTLANSKEHTFSSPEAFHEFFEIEIFNKNQDNESRFLE